jgi:ABC-2 type transport system permease protein
LLVYTATIGLGILVLSLLGAGLAAGSGILISLRAATVRQAYQQLSLASIFLPGLLALGFLALPGEWKTQLAKAVFTANEGQILVAAGIVLVIVDITLILVARARFRRARLILD